MRVFYYEQLHLTDNHSLQFTVTLVRTVNSSLHVFTVDVEGAKLFKVPLIPSPWYFEQWYFEQWYFECAT